jgi:hypothetical protein
MKFYLSQNVARLVEVAGKQFVFETATYMSPTASWWGTLAPGNPEDELLLDEAVKSGLVEEISADDYALFEVKKKSIVSPSNTIGLRNWHAPQMGAPKLQDVAPVVAANIAAIESVAEALTVRPAVRPAVTAPAKPSKK